VSVRLSQASILSKCLNVGSYDAKDLYKILMGSPQQGRQMQVRWVKIAFFDQLRSLLLRHLTADNLCPFATVVRVHDGALAKEYAVSLTTLVVVEVG